MPLLWKLETRHGVSLYSVSHCFYLISVPACDNNLDFQLGILAKTLSLKKPRGSEYHSFPGLCVPLF
ncbi:hypothetical protein EUGRSUZ_B01681 [Eucalyptus grandis]|uniref:Uncharacterized protein n=2 Tax=Eucalyptus grandis TaxID=71139 RepID=A0ACC3LRN6_EUCGR|nr:hypothetical protein EUGRSUZ_B01681 [Eucalyptus grandis]